MSQRASSAATWRLAGNVVPGSALAALAVAYRNPVPVERPSGEQLETFAGLSGLRASDGS